MTYKVDDIYPVVAKVATASFTEKQVAEGQRALFVVPWIENIESPTQIGAALQLLQQMQGSPVERQMLFSGFSRSINRDFKDDRSFADSLRWGIVAPRIGKLTAGVLTRSKLIFSAHTGQCFSETFAAPMRRIMR